MPLCIEILLIDEDLQTLEASKPSSSSHNRTPHPTASSLLSELERQLVDPESHLRRKSAFGATLSIGTEVRKVGREVLSQQNLSIVPPYGPDVAGHGLRGLSKRRNRPKSGTSSPSQSPPPSYRQPKKLLESLDFGGGPSSSNDDAVFPPDDHDSDNHEVDVEASRLVRQGLKVPPIHRFSKVVGGKNGQGADAPGNNNRKSNSSSTSASAVAKTWLGQLLEPLGLSLETCNPPCGLGAAGAHGENEAICHCLPDKARPRSSSGPRQSLGGASALSGHSFFGGSFFENNGGDDDDRDEVPYTDEEATSYNSWPLCVPNCFAALSTEPVKKSIGLSCTSTCRESATLSFAAAAIEVDEFELAIVFAPQIGGSWTRQPDPDRLSALKPAQENSLVSPEKATGSAAQKEAAAATATTSTTPAAAATTYPPLGALADRSPGRAGSLKEEEADEVETTDDPQGPFPSDPSTRSPGTGVATSRNSSYKSQTKVSAASTNFFWDTSVGSMDDNTTKCASSLASSSPEAPEMTGTGSNPRTGSKSESGYAAPGIPDTSTTCASMSLSSQLSMATGTRTAATTTASVPAVSTSATSISPPSGNFAKDADTLTVSTSEGSLNSPNRPSSRLEAWMAPYSQRGNSAKDSPKGLPPAQTRQKLTWAPTEGSPHQCWTVPPRLVFTWRGFKSCDLGSGSHWNINTSEMLGSQMSRGPHSHWLEIVGQPEGAPNQVSAVVAVPSERLGKAIAEALGKLKRRSQRRNSERMPGDDAEDSSRQYRHALRVELFLKAPLMVDGGQGAVNCASVVRRSLAEAARVGAHRIRVCSVSQV